MPEVCEITLTAQYLNSKLKTRNLTNIHIQSGRYIYEIMKGLDIARLMLPLRFDNIDSKGKFMYSTLTSLNPAHLDKKVYFCCSFGLTGEWSFSESSSPRLKFEIQNGDHTLIYYDHRNFGNLWFTTEISDLNKKLDKLAPDFLKTNFSSSDFIQWTNLFLQKSTKRSSVPIVKALMEQTKATGIGSGLGNYLAPEILYRAKISPHRTVGSLSNADLITLSNEIKYLTKLCYLSNKTGYMFKLKNYVDTHYDKVKNGNLPNYHPDVLIKSNDTFAFNVYQQTKDSHGNPVTKDKDIVKGRSTYWVPAVQK